MTNAFWKISWHFCKYIININSSTKEVLTACGTYHFNILFNICDIAFDNFVASFWQMFRHISWPFPHIPSMKVEAAFWCFHLAILPQVHRDRKREGLLVSSWLWLANLGRTHGGVKQHFGFFFQTRECQEGNGLHDQYPFKGMKSIFSELHLHIPWTMDPIVHHHLINLTEWEARQL